MWKVHSMHEEVVNISYLIDEPPDTLQQMNHSIRLPEKINLSFQHIKECMIPCGRRFFYDNHTTHT
jgi:hypothetical protein